MKTSKGDLTIELYPKEAPTTVENFLSYMKDGFYNGTIFHRVIENFVVQGGGYGTDLGKKETLEPIVNEARNKISNERGTIAMARLPEPHTATSQFFINVTDNGRMLDYQDDVSNQGYCVFGKVTDGMDVMDEIRRVKTGSNAIGADAPIENVEILSVETAE